MKFQAQKTPMGLIPITDEDRELYNKIGMNEVVKITTVDQRNYKLLQKYWVLMHFGFKNLGEEYDGYFLNAEDFEDEVLKAIGWRTRSKNLRGEEVIKSKSISFENCPEESVFQKIYDRSVTVIAKTINSNDEAVRNELVGFM